MPCKESAGQIITRSKSKTRDTVGPLLDNTGRVVDDVKEICEFLNDYFSSVFTVENVNDLPIITQVKNNCEPECLQSSLATIDITEKLVLQAIKGLKPNKTGGVDELNSSLLLGVAESIVGPLTILFRKSLETGIIPDDWKCANVTPIFKKGSKKKAENYRPVSLTSHICKILERIINQELVNHRESMALTNLLGPWDTSPPTFET